MSTEVAEAKPADSAPFQRAARPADHSSAGEVGHINRRGSAARGIMIAVLISFPFWVLVGVAIYLFA
jgi:hypothetical protein